MNLFELDGNLLLWIQEYIRNGFLTPFMTTITHLGDAGIFWIITSLVMLIPKKTRRAGLAGIFALLCSLVVNNLCLKPLVHRTRPYEMIPDLTLLVKKQVDYSFPSGHTGASFAAAVAYAGHIKKRYAIGFLVLAGIIACSRLYVGVHYPTDVLGGLITGIGCGFCGYRLERFATTMWEKKRICANSDENTMEN